MTDNTIGILTSGLKKTRQQIEVSMHNITNADTPNYSTKILDTSAAISGNTLQGVQVDAIRSRTDTVLQQQLLNAKSQFVMYNAITESYKRIQDAFALPGSDQGLINHISGFFGAINSLSLDPSSDNMRNDMVDKANNIARYISDLSLTLNKERYDADHEVAKSLWRVNDVLSTLHQLSTKRLTQKYGSVQYSQTEDDINTALQELSKYFEVTHYYDDNRILRVALKENGQEIVGKQLYSFDYAPAKSITDFVEENSLNPIYLISRSVTGQHQQQSMLVSGGPSSDVTYNLSGGLVSGLMQLRDIEIPRIAATVDEIALNIAKEINIIHNRGNGFEPMKELLGTVGVRQYDNMIANGKILVNAMTDDGTPIATGFYGQVPALQLDLSAFSTSIIPGAFNVRGIVDEINRYFTTASHGNRLDINGFHNIQLAATSRDTTVGSTLELDFDLLAYTLEDGVQDMKLYVNSVDVTDSNGNAILSTTTNLGNAYTVQNGSYERTGRNGGPKISIPNTANYPLTVKVDMKTIVNGVETIATVNYKIDEPTATDVSNLNGILNKRFQPVSSSDNVSIKSGSLSNSVIKASIVDEYGVELSTADTNTLGFLKIESVLKNTGVAVNQLESNITSSDNKSIGGGFCSAFGLNDAFIFTKHNRADHLKNVARYVKLNDTIIKNPNAFSVGTMQPYRRGNINRDAPAIFFSIGVGDTTFVTDYQNLERKRINFSDNDNIDSRVTTIKGYALDIVSVTNIKTINFDVKTNYSEQLQNTFADELSAKTGVNKDDEIIYATQCRNALSFLSKGTKIALAVNEIIFDIF